MRSRRAEPRGAARAFGKGFDNVKLSLNDRDNHQLRNALHGFERKRFAGAIPNGNHEFPLVVRINETDEVSEDNAFFVPESATRQDKGRIVGISDMNTQARVHLSLIHI